MGKAALFFFFISEKNHSIFFWLLRLRLRLDLNVGKALITALIIMLMEGPDKESKT